MALVSLQNISLRFGGPSLLDDATLQIERGERVCLLGRNGEGKSTLLGILAGNIDPDRGEIVIQGGVRIALLPQAVPQGLKGCVADLVAEGLELGHEDWEGHQRVDRLLSKMGLDGEMIFDDLSGGQKRRALLARALVLEPDVLVLDEPTNHLDIDSIQWLESFLLRFSGSILFVTHDRAFLRSLATRIVELDRGKLKSWACDYDKFLELRQVELEAEEKHNALFDKKLAQEETWLRKGIKARRTRNEGRVRALKKLREERSHRRNVTGTAKMQVQDAQSSGRKVIEVEDATFAWGDQPILDHFNSLILRGDKVGIIGPNGCGKTTLLNLLLGRLAPQSGTVTQGTRLEIAYFDQHREAIDGNKTVAQNVADDNQFIVLNGQRRHVMSYLEDFLFAPERSRTPARVLSGGERNRLLLAKLFTRPSNVLVMDEPTNDLDAETLELLEDLLVEYPGTLLLVSHDREFINNVVSSTLVFEEGKGVREYAGGYDDWLSQRAAEKAIAAKPAAPAPSKAPPRRKLSNREREELKKLPAQIEQLEATLQRLQAQMLDPEFFRGPMGEVKATSARAEKLPVEIEAAMARWEELDALDR